MSVCVRAWVSMFHLFEFVIRFYLPVYKISRTCDVHLVLWNDR